MKPALVRLRDELVRLDRFPPTSYRVPGAWVGGQTCRTEASAARYFLTVVEEILSTQPIEAHRASRTGVIYNALVRHVTSYDHGPEAIRDGWRTTGTFLKMIALLPYLRSINIGTILLLPINELGSVGQKGTHGSPYSVRNPFAIEPGLAEPLVELTAQEQAQAFVEAAHRMGMKVITEVVLRTASLDSDLAGDHPEWFYWIDADKADTFTAPVFSDEQCTKIIAQVEGGSRSLLPEPSSEYQRLFTEPPVQRHRDALGWTGTLAVGEHVRIPGAFADWPPNDPQPAWSDVTYLRLHHHPDFPYMAYNTIRMFDERMDTPDMENIGLWNTIAAIIPTQMRILGTDGAMIDMGHALPSSLRQRIISEARQHNPDAVMIEENFHLDTTSAQDGFTIVTGYLPFDGHSADGLRRFVERVATADVPIGFMGWGESHNTPRLASRIDQRACASVWTFMSLLPRSAPCILAGMELGETRPMNTGLGFTPEQIAQWPASELALFSDVPLDWDGGVENLAHFRRVIEILQSYDVIRHFTADDRVDALTCDHDTVVAFHRQVRGSSRGLVTLLNLSSETLHIHVDLESTDISAIAVEPRCSLQGKVLRCVVPAYTICCVPTHGVGTWI